MATVRNTLETQFTSRGAGRVVKDTDSIGKAQTRLGQASASAGRGFAAQSSGMGGLVGIYAAAAANVFAISAAFEALNAAAKFDTIIRGTEQLASAVGTSAASVIGALKSITDEQLSMAEAAKNANLALSAGFDLDQIEKLGNVANKASKALGRNLTDAFQRITRGAIKLEPELLDEIGIFTRIEPAVQAYANSIGKSVNQLTNFERRQAFVNQVIIDGEQAFASINMSGKSTQKSFEQLVATFSDLAIKAAVLVADGLAPVADFLNKNLGNQLILLGAIGALVFGKLSTAVSAFAGGALASLSVRLSAVATSMAAVKVSSEEMSQKTTEAADRFVGQGALAGSGRAGGSELKQQLATGALSTVQAQQAQSNIPKFLEEEKRLRASNLALQQRGLMSQEAFNTSRLRSLNRSRALLATQRLVNVQLAQSGVLANALAAGLRGAAVAAGLVAKGFGVFLMVLNGIVIAFTVIQAIASALDIDVFGAVKDMYLDLTKASREAAEGNKILMQGLLNETSVYAEVIQRLRAEGAQVTEESSPQDLLADAEKAARAANRAVRSLENAVERAAVDVANGGRAGDYFQDLIFGQGDALQSYTDKLASYEQQLESASAEQARLNALVADLKGIVGVGTLIGQIEGVQEGAGTIAAKSLTRSAVNDDAAKSGATVATVGTRQGDELQELRLELEAVSGFTESIVANFGNMTNFKLNSEVNVESFTSAADAISKFTELNAKLATGAINAETASRDIDVLIKAIENSMDTFVSGNGANNVIELLRVLKASAAETQEVVNAFTSLDAIFKKLNKTFSSELTFLDNLVESGTLSAGGEFARSAEEAAGNQVKTFQLLKDQLDQIRQSRQEGAAISSTEKTLADTTLLIAKKLTVEQIKFINGSEAKIKAENRAVKALESQLALLKAQLAVKQRTRDLAMEEFNFQGRMQVGFTTRETDKLRDDAAQPDILEQIRTNRANKGTPTDSSKTRIGKESVDDKAGIFLGTQRLALSKAALSIQERENSLTAAKLSMDEKTTGLLKEQTSLRRKARSDAASAGVGAAGASGSALVAQAQRAAVIIQEQSLSTTTQIKEAKLAVAKAELDAAMGTIGAQANQATVERDNAMDEIVEKRNLLEKQARLATEEATRQQDLMRDRIHIASQEREQGIIEARREVQRTIDRKQTIIDEATALRKKIVADNNVKQAALQARKFELKMLQERIKNNKTFLEDYNFIIDKQGKNLGTYDPTQSKLPSNKKIEDPSEVAVKLIDTMVASIDKQIGLQTDLTRARLVDSIAEQTQLEKIRDLQLGLDRDKVTDLVKMSANMDELESKELAAFDTKKERIASDLIKSLGNLDLESEAVSKAFMTRMGELGIEGKLAKDIFNQVKADLDYELSAKERMVELGKSIAFGISDTLGSAVMTFLTNIQQGKPLIEGIGDLFIKMLFDIQQKILQATIIDPMTTAVSDTLVKSFAGLMIASGGSVRHMAEGGQVNSLRDRVPAMLEPGEFVIRKTAAKSIGHSRLGKMNATGAGGMGNVQFNIVNNGEPKSAEQQGSPKIDTDKIVIDVVMRDLKSNGPIRQAMRN